jgi:predicted nucleic acid-binding protein
MYLVGAEHPNKTAARLALETCAAHGERMVTSAEVMQEILHRYQSIHRPAAIQPALDVLLGVVDEVFPIEAEDVRRAKDVLQGVTKISARDALHVAIMRRHQVHRVMSFDVQFDRVSAIERVY